MTPVLTQAQWREFAAYMLNDAATRPAVQRGRHQDKPLEGASVGYGGAQRFRGSDLPMREQIAISALTRAGLSRLEACKVVAAWVYKPDLLDGLPQQRRDYLKKRAVPVTKAGLQRGRRLTPVIQLKPGSRDARRLKRAISELASRSDQANPVSRLVASGADQIRAQRRGTAASHAESLRTAKPASEAELADAAWDWWWHFKTFKAGNVSPFTGKRMRKAEFPCGWAHHVAIFCGYSITAGLKWTGGWTHDPIEAEKCVRAAGLVPMDEERQLGWVPPHLR